jgi:nitroimidazol reductase NimA-like FMN-containing flavoprotein (pyridoxamine 5'-phosphate oxidase superfamily)
MRRKDRNVAEIEHIEQIIRKSDVCRIALADNNIPYIVTMNFGYTGGPHPCFYFHCAPEGRKIEMLKKNNYVCFELDTDHELTPGERGCDWGMKFSSVIGYGRISILKEKDLKIEALNCLMSQYSKRNDFTYDEANLDKITILKLDIEEITGKKI